MNQDKVILNVSTSENEIIIRHGEALPQSEPSHYFFSGDIESPLNFLRARAQTTNIDQTTGVFEIDTVAGSITLKTNPYSKYGETIFGALKVDQELINHWGINVSCRDKSPKEMAQFLRRNRRFFIDGTQCDDVVKALAGISVKTTSNVDRNYDNRGNKSEKSIQVVESNIPISFKISLPVFLTKSPLDFNVDIIIQMVNNEPFLSLDCIEFEYIIENAKRKILLSVIEDLNKEFPDFPFLYK